LNIRFVLESRVPCEWWFLTTVLAYPVDLDKLTNHKGEKSWPGILQVPPLTILLVSDGYAHDYSYFKGLVDKTAQSGFTMKEVSADKGYLGASNMLATLQHGAVPYIPFKSNSVPDSRGSYGAKSELWSRMYHFYALNRAEFLTHYHKRSNVETTFHMIKAKFGQRLRSRTLTAQINEALCKVLCHNLCVVIQSVHELGIEAAFATETAE
jgi:hypothetical protein